ncbi:hypothetical protein KIKIMORA_03920 [Brevundimonas phage vB_BpoS-Kikimora]|uniref:Uncharacterized protein n=1 Tax=Brevundimonas phage vB_BpoS-Kikimora TaxID=2948601 RepID=A0A9E7MRV3_9CAUD|nr:hypothetical protein KIKIMORA_03920 [Brevundimonas phage vB_BpoS-Kikimora]
MLEYSETFMQANDRALRRLEADMGPAFAVALMMAWDAREEPGEDVPEEKRRKDRRRS